MGFSSYEWLAFCHHSIVLKQVLMLNILDLDGEAFLLDKLRVFIGLEGWEERLGVVMPTVK